MKKLLSIIFLLLPICIQAQIIKEINIDGETVKIYRLDDKQKKNLAEAKYTKDKTKNAEFIQEIFNNYSKLEAALDSGNTKEAQESLKLIDFRLGSDSPNLKYLREEYNVYANRDRVNRGREARKQYIDSIKASLPNK